MNAIPLLLLFVVTPHVKVFRDDAVPDSPVQKIEAACARDEFEPAQFIIRPSRELHAVTVETGALRNEAAGSVIPAERVKWNFVGYIPVAKNTPGTPVERLVRKAPCSIPDVLLEKESIDIKAGTCQPVWLTFHVPAGAPAGIYRGKVTVRAGDAEASLPVELEVWPFSVPRERHLYVTNWFSTSSIAKAHGVAEWSDAYWPLLESYFRDMAAHRQNVAWVPWRHIHATRLADGRLACDFSRFDRYVAAMERCGVGDRIEIQPVAHFGRGGWSGSTIQFARLSVRDEATGKTIGLGFEEGLGPFLSELELHLQERGWLEKSMIHISDEPSLGNLRSYCECAAAVAEAAPGIKRIEAIEASDFSGCLEVWVPKLTHLDVWHPYYEAAQKAGAELWFYTCCHPTGGRYPNRFLDSPLVDVRLLHWINARYGLEGYLHWGLNHWPDNPFGTPRDGLPPGDTHIVYPGKDGPLDSIRWEMMREGLEDYEYFWLLDAALRRVKERLGKAAARLDPTQRKRELSARLVHGFADLERDPRVLRATRRQLAAEIVAADKAPAVIVNTRPDANSVLVEGPIWIEIRGATLPGAKVTINNRRVEVLPDGTFLKALGISRGHETVRIRVVHDDAVKVIERRFRIHG